MLKHPTRLGLPVSALLLLALSSACEQPSESEDAACVDGQCDAYDGGDGDGDDDGPSCGYDCGPTDSNDGYDGYDDPDLYCDENFVQETKLVSPLNSEQPACDASGPSEFSVTRLDSGATWVAEAFMDNACDSLVCLAQHSLRRSSDFLNAFDFGYPAAAPGEVEISADLLALNEDGEFTLMFGVSSEHKGAEELRPLHIGLVIDTTSPAGSGVLPRERAAAYEVAKSLRAGDQVSLVGVNKQAQMLLDHYEVSGPNDPVLLAAIDGLKYETENHFNFALQTLYFSMRSDFDADRVNRVLLLVRADMVISSTLMSTIRSAAEYGDSAGITLSALAFTREQPIYEVTPYDLSDSLLLAAQVGQGSLLLATNANADGDHLSKDFVKNVDIAAHDLHVEVSLPPGFALATKETVYGQLAPTGDPEHLAPNSALVRTMRLTVCDPELLSLNPSIKITAHFNDPVTMEPKTFEREFPVAELMATTSPRAVKAQALLRSLDALHKLALCDDSAIDQAIEVLQDAMSQLPDDVDLPALAMQMTKPLGMWEVQ